MGIDETAFPIDGKTGWMWTARNKAAAHYSLKSGRGGRVLKKIWKKFDGILASDGFVLCRTVFSGSERQRRTAHLQRNAKHLAKRSEHRPARILYGEL